MKPTDGPRTFPRAVDYDTPPPDVTKPDPVDNAKELRHAIKGALQPARLAAHTIRTGRHRMTDEDWQECLDMLDRSIEAAVRDVDLLRELPPQPQSKEA
jgi:hypothetical protein